VDEVFVAGPAVDDVDAEVARHLVAGARPAEDLVVAERAADLVLGPGAAVDFVVAAAAVHLVGPRAAADQIVAEAAEDDVVATAAPDHVAFGGSPDHVVLFGADDLRQPTVAARPFPAVRAQRDGAHRESGKRQQRKSDDPPRQSHVGWIVTPGQALRINFLLTNSSAP
jgi:hypothetical protein